MSYDEAMPMTLSKYLVWLELQNLVLMVCHRCCLNLKITAATPTPRAHWLAPPEQPDLCLFWG